MPMISDTVGISSIHGGEDVNEGYTAIVQEIAGSHSPGGADALDGVCAKITAGGFKDGAEWIEQLRMARKVFAR